jgi:hypothetical protein
MNKRITRQSYRLIYMLVANDRPLGFHTEASDRELKTGGGRLLFRHTRTYTWMAATYYSGD